MFRIKKEDYNTVQFMPDFQSGGKRGGYKKPKPVRAAESVESMDRKTRTRNRMLAVIFILLAILIAVWFAYIRLFTEEAQYIRLFRHEEYNQCRQIAENHVGDLVFQEKIKDTVVQATDDAMSQFLARAVTEEQVQNTLTQYNEASAGMFAQYIGDNQHWAGTVESIYQKAAQASGEAKLGYYSESITKLQQVAEEAGKNNIILDQQITEILRDNLAGYKAKLFVNFADTIRYSSDYSTIRDIITFVTRYIEDDDFKDFEDVVNKVDSGALAKLDAARTARQIAKNAGADIEVEAGSGSAGSSANSDSDRKAAS